LSDQSDQSDGCEFPWVKAPLQWGEIPHLVDLHNRPENCGQAAFSESHFAESISKESGKRLLAPNRVKLSVYAAMPLFS